MNFTLTFFRVLTMQGIKDECNRLIDDDSIDKKTALGMMKVQHSMETLMSENMHTQQFEKMKLENEIQLIKITSKNSETIEEMKTSIEELTRSLTTLEKNQNEVTKTLEEVADMIDKVKEQFKTKILQLENNYGVVVNALESVNQNMPALQKQNSKKKN